MTIGVGVGVVFLLFVPPRVGDGRPLVGMRRRSHFDRRESYFLARRVLLDDPAKAASRLRISGRDVAGTARNPRVLVHTLITLITPTATLRVNAINNCGPTVIKGLGYSTVRANALASVGAFIAVVMVVVLGWLCDFTGRKGPFVLFGAVWSMIAFTCLREGTMNKWSTGRKYAAVIFSMSTNTVVHIMNVGWLSANCQRPQERSVAMA